MDDGTWFSLALSPWDAPYLFKEDGDSQWASTAAELLAVLVALHLFGFMVEGVDADPTPLVVSAGTDNLANEFLIRKGLTTKWPLCLIFMQLTDCLMFRRVLVQLKWRPRDQNVLADALTNEDFTGVDAAKRIQCTWSDFDFHLLETLWKARATFLDRQALKATSKDVNLGKFEKSNW